MRCCCGFRGLNVAFSGTDLRGPEANSHTTPSVRPLKWQLEHDCQPLADRRSLVATAAPAGRAKLPREEKNISAPTLTPWPIEPAGAGADDWIVLMTRSFDRSTTETLRETKSFTYARVPAELTTMPCGFLPAFAPAVAGFAGSSRSMSRVVSASVVNAIRPSAATRIFTRRSLPADTR